MLVDDLVTRGVDEPYRMFTSRAEHRLLLREDNADLRLTPAGRELGLVDDERWRRFCERREAIEREQARLAATWLRPAALDPAAATAVLGAPLGREQTLASLLARPDVSYERLMTLPGAGPAVAAADVAQQVEVQARYAGYIERQRRDIERARGDEDLRLPEDLDYASVRGLSAEVSEKLAARRPVTLGLAARIPGMTPAAVSLLRVHLRRRREGGASAPGADTAPVAGEGAARRRGA